MSNIAVIGSGNIGGTLARAWSSAGHAVTFGSRDPAKPALRELADRISAGTASIADAVAGSEVVLFAIPGSAMAITVPELGSRLDGKVAIDATNSFGAGTANSAATIAAAAPRASYVRAFNTLGWELFDRPTVGGVQVDLFFCGPDGEPRSTVERLITDVGLRPVWVGGPEEAEVVDGLLRLWFTLAVRRQLGRRLAFTMVQD